MRALRDPDGANLDRVQIIKGWMTYDAKIFGVDLPGNVPASFQERAYTSPIWYTPRH